MRTITSYLLTHKNDVQLLLLLLDNVLNAY